MSGRPIRLQPRTADLPSSSAVIGAFLAGGYLRLNERRTVQGFRLLEMLHSGQRETLRLCLAVG